MINRSLPMILGVYFAALTAHLFVSIAQKHPARGIATEPTGVARFDAGSRYPHAKFAD